jgi:hypothetical protein
VRGGGILGLELRRSVAPWAGAIFLLAAVAYLYLLSGPWWKGTTAMTAQWTSAAQWERHLLLFLWPLVVAAGAVQGMRDHRSGMTELLATTPRPAAGRVARTAGSLAIALAAGYLLLFLHNAAWVIASGGAFHLGWLPILLVGVLAMVAGGLAGMGVGRVLPSPLTPPAAAVVALVGLIFLFLLQVRGEEAQASGMPVRLPLLSPVLPQVRDEFALIAGRVHLGQAVWLAGLAAAGVVLLLATRARTRLLALPLLGVAAAVALALLPSSSAAITTVNREVSGLVCEGRVCLSRLHQARLADYAAAGAEALRLLSAMPDPPTAVREVPSAAGIGGAMPRAADTVYIRLGDPALRSAETPRDITRVLVAGAGTPACRTDAHPDPGALYREAAARTVAAAWFLGDYAPLPGEGAIREYIDPFALPAWERLTALPAEEQRERVAALRSAALTCQGDLLDVLNRGGAR